MAAAIRSEVEVSCLLRYPVVLAHPVVLFRGTVQLDGDARRQKTQTVFDALVTERVETGHLDKSRREVGEILSVTRCSVGRCGGAICSPER